MKQPKYFYKSSPHSSTKTAVTLDLNAQEKKPDVSPVSRGSKINVSSKFLLGIGLAPLVILAFLGIIPRLPKFKKPAFLTITRHQTSPVVLEQKGGMGIASGIQFDARTADSRVEIVALFLERYNSPLKPAREYARSLVEIADKYSLDYRLLPAIMMQESNLCKASDPAIHNCLGFGIHARGTLAFDSYEEGFDRAARELKERYIDIGLVTPEQIMTKYTPSSNGSWANSVNQWIAEMEYNSRQKGIENKQDMDLTVYAK